MDWSKITKILRLGSAYEIQENWFITDGIFFCKKTREFMKERPLFWKHNCNIYIYELKELNESAPTKTKGHRIHKESKIQRLGSTWSIPDV